MDGTEHLPDQIAETNRGMAKTNEGIHQQTIGIALAALQAAENRKVLFPVPSRMMPFGKTMAEALTPEETVLFFEGTLASINEGSLNPRNQSSNPNHPQYLSALEQFENDKQGDIMMLLVIAGFLPTKTIQAIIDQEAEQGAHRKELFEILMLRSNFTNDVLLNGMVMKGKLETNGSINDAIEYNSHIDFIDKLPFADQIGIKITGFTTPELNFEAHLDTTMAVSNWNRINASAQSDFKATSYAKDPAQKNNSEAGQITTFKASLTVIKNFLTSWGVEPAPLN